MARGISDRTISAAGRLGRRAFVSLLAGAAAWPVAAGAQQGARARRIGVLMSVSESDPEVRLRIAAFHEELQRLGWKPGSNVRLDYRWAQGRSDLLERYAAELVSASPDALLANGTPALSAVRRHTGAIPTVFVQVADPVYTGIVASLARPGGNVTGFTNYEYTMAEKWLELLRDVAPGLTRVLVLFNPDNPGMHGFLQTIDAMGRAIGIAPVEAAVRDADDIARAFEAFASGPRDGLLVLNDLVTTVHRNLIVATAGRHKLPAIYPFRNFVTSGGLMAYGVEITDIAVRRPTCIAFSTARSPPSCRCNCRPSSSSSSICRPRRRSASRSRPCCSRAPTR
jgi:putative ABC transport system substrate-binding protein